MDNPFTEAVAERFGIRAIIYGDAGGGKTLTALKMAMLLGGQTAFVEADKGRALHKAPKPGNPRSGFKFDHVMCDRYDWQTLVKYIKAAQEHGYQNLIIDSISRFWNDESGLQDYKDKKAKESKKGDYAWGDVNKAQRQIYNALDDFTGRGGNVILCARRKLLFVQQGQKREIVGDAPEFRDDLAYEFDLVLRAEINEYTEATPTGEEVVSRHELSVRKADIDEYDIDGKHVHVTPLLPAGRIIGEHELGDFVAILQDHFGEGSGTDWHEQAKAFTGACLKHYPSAPALREAWRSIQEAINAKLWPPHIKRAARADLVDAAQQMGGGQPEAERAIGAGAPHGWRALTQNSPVEDWTEAGTQILEADTAEVDAFEAHAKACEREGTVAQYVRARREELGATPTGYIE